MKRQQESARVPRLGRWDCNCGRVAQVHWTTCKIDQLNESLIYSAKNHALKSEPYIVAHIATQFVHWSLSAFLSLCFHHTVSNRQFCLAKGFLKVPNGSWSIDFLIIVSQAEQNSLTNDHVQTSDSGEKIATVNVVLSAAEQLLDVMSGRQVAASSRIAPHSDCTCCVAGVTPNVSAVR